MSESSSVKRRQILQPSLDIVDRHSGLGRFLVSTVTTSYYHCVPDRDCAGIAVINASQ